MEWTFLGTGAGSPSRTRNVSALALRLPQRSEWWLFDCGEGTQHQLLKAPHLRLSQLSRIFITHMHGDHCYGLPGLLASRGLALGGESPITLHGPEGLGKWVITTMRLSGNRPTFPLHMDAVDTGWSLHDTDLTVTVAKTDHRTESYAFKVTESDALGSFDIARARAMQLPSGNLFGRLKAGEVVTLDDGRILDGSDFVGPAKPGRVSVYTGDTRPSHDIVTFATNADLLIHDSTFGTPEQDHAEKSAHSTAAEAAQIALSANVKQLVLTHFSSRYDAQGLAYDLKSLLQDAKDIFPNTVMASDFMRLTIERNPV